MYRSNIYEIKQVGHREVNICWSWTSGRIAIQDGVELLPTFGWPENRLEYIMAGGEKQFLNLLNLPKMMSKFNKDCRKIKY